MWDKLSSWISKDDIRKITHSRIEIVNGLDAFVPRIGIRSIRSNSAALIYYRNGIKIFRVYIDSISLNELFLTISRICQNQDQTQEEYLTINNTEIFLERVLELVSIHIVISNHKVVVTGVRSQLQSSVARYHSVSRSFIEEADVAIKILLRKVVSSVQST
jgi:hypothetical protein